MESFLQIIKTISDKMKAIAAACLVGMMLLTCTDVVGRFFKHPVFGSVELVTFLAVLAVALSLPHTHEAKGHIGVELVVRKFSPRTQGAIDMITGITSLILFGLVSWRMFDYAMKIRASGEVSMNLQLPEYMIIFIVAACFFVLFMIIVKGIVCNFKILRKK